MKHFFTLVVLSALLLTGCASALTPAPSPAPVTSEGTLAPTPLAEPRTLTVFAAASLTDAFSELGKAFELSHPGVTVTFNFAGSQTLRTQIVEGAQADVFASANVTEMQTLADAALVDADAPSRIFVNNKLIVIIPDSNPANIESLEKIADPGIKMILASEEVPAGKYARAMLEKLNAEFGAGFDQKVLANVVSNEDNVRQVLTKIQLGEGDAGIVYMTDALVMSRLQVIQIPDEYNSIAQYPISALKNAPNADLAAQFVDFILSSDAQTILQRWGFIIIM
jgi:molybdate transport system substrate-binding protein